VYQALDTIKELNQLYYTNEETGLISGGVTILSKRQLYKRRFAAAAEASSGGK
jgi:hypothetical protein